MIVFCDDCDKCFLQPYLLARHKKRKTPCWIASPDKDSQNSPQPVVEEVSNSLLMTTISEIPQRTHQRSLYTRIASLQEQVRRLSTAGDTSVVVTGRRTKNAGSESIDHITALSYEQLKKTLQLRPNNETIFRMIKLCNLNKEYLENANFKLTSATAPTALVFKRGRWREMPTRQAILTLISNSILKFFDIEHLLEAHMQPRLFKDLADFLESCETLVNRNQIDSALEELVKKTTTAVHNFSRLYLK